MTILKKSMVYSSIKKWYIIYIHLSKRKKEDYFLCKGLSREHLFFAHKRTFMMKSQCDRNSNLVHVNSSINHRKVELCCDWWRDLEFSSHLLSIRLACVCVQIRSYRSLFLVNVYNLWLPIHRLLDREYIKVQEFPLEWACTT